MSYQLLIERPAQKTLGSLGGADRARITEAIRSLREAPRPAGAKKLSARDAWRIRVGVYRVIYEFYDDRLVVLVIRIGHRREVYRR
ncbi:MAG: type II toxin-antitoxin system RelE/ParE family toxin [Deferrisomatales bacterium]|nr:type II toxin-antitoxin system RelE/ParE family toxin [Deferrisomatales bacterium]